MITITIFTGKGGMGKTTLTTMLASYLSYEKGENVYAMDIDNANQMYNIRNRELEFVEKNPDSYAARLASEHEPFRLARVRNKDYFSNGELMKMATSLKQQTAGHDGYFLLDFPGHYMNSDPVSYLSERGLIDLVVMPIDSDKQSQSMAMENYTRMRERSENECGWPQEIVFLWNRETAKERTSTASRRWFNDPETLYNVMGIPVISTRMHEIQSARCECNAPFFVRSTLCWPKGNIARACPYITDIFDEIVQRARDAAEKKAAVLSDKYRNTSASPV